MFSVSRKKIIAFFFLIIFSIDLFYPVTAHALTSGPSQPEMTKFEPAGVNNLVNLFSGDLNYNLPLMDVEGYPINLSYQSGTGMDDEASWVGTGWTLNPGAVSRTMRGLPDDFDGSGSAEDRDEIIKEFDKKEFKKVGGTLTLKPQLFSNELGSASAKLSFYKDNYYGIGASISAGVSVSLAKLTGAPLTAGLDITSDTRDGVTIQPNLGLSITHQDKADNDYVSGSLSGSLSYNSRGGLKNYSLSATFSAGTKYKDENKFFEYDRSAVHYFGQSYTPSIPTNIRNYGNTFSFDAGPAVLVGYLGVGGSGYTYKEEIVEKVSKAPAFGYMNYLKGKDSKSAMLDFNREKDGTFLRTAPSIATPVATNDFFMATGQTGSNQFRPYFAGNYIVFDAEHYNKNNNTSGGITLGLGPSGYQGGLRVEKTSGETRTGPWFNGNGYRDAAAYYPDGIQNALEEPIAFKRVGEHTPPDALFYNLMGKSETEKVRVVKSTNGALTGETVNYLEGRTPASNLDINQRIQKARREVRNHLFSYLNAFDASRIGLDKKIYSYGFANGKLTRSESSRYNSYRKKRHISEITVTDDQGKRMVYGIPVYNLQQQEITFSVAPPTRANQEAVRRSGLIGYTGDPSTDHNYGRDNLYSNTITPGYATSFLLTGVLSSDYVDRTDNGITDDDLGTAIKFNYKLSVPEYKWRAPFQQEKANYNEGFISDTKDDKGSIMYGKKELWYLQSIEGKTLVAVFETSPREDGLGVVGRNGGATTQIGEKQQKLDRIKLFTKAELEKNGGNAVPIKVVHFEYDYSLYPGVTNNSGAVVLRDPNDPNSEKLNEAKGKLTLKRVYFTFGNSSRGKSNPYDFEYDMRMIHSISGLPASSIYEEQNDKYYERQSDRWGTYKQGNINPGGMNNSEYPYVVQNNVSLSYNARELANRLSSKWQLTKVITPAGGIIDIEYEADDYAYVQNRRAMQMFELSGFQGGTSLMDANKLIVKLPKEAGNYFKRDYLTEADGSEMKKIYFRVYVDLDNRGHKEYVSGYADLDLENFTPPVPTATTVTIPIKRVGNYSSISKAAWQMLFADLPQYAYDNYDNLNVGDGTAAIKSILTALGNLGEFKKKPDERAFGRKFASRLDVSKSFIRLYNPDQKKIGGGSRVKQVTISDEWYAMTGNVKSVTGQRYNYETKNNRGEPISSGVAAYEPSTGNEENPFHEPVSFVEDVQWSSDRYHFIEKPYCETYFPAPSVGYSLVKVTSFGNGSGISDAPTGYIENEFYTAEDFPTIVDNLPLTTLPIKNSLILQLFSGRSINKMATSQGFKVELNDMHGKEKAVKVYNKGGDMISSSEYFYSVKDQKAQFKELDNEIDVLDENGTIHSNTMIGTDIDFVTDMRQSISETKGTSTGIYYGVGYFFFPLVHGAIIPNHTESIDQFQSSSMVKVIQKFGILTRTVTTQNGSTIEAENLLWDGQTGEVVLTRTQNEYDKFTYAFTYPAYRAYDGMGAAYKNHGANLYFATYSYGEIVDYDYNENASQYLQAGDELWSPDLNKRAWVIQSWPNMPWLLQLIDADGNLLKNRPNAWWTVVRSVRRNMVTAATGSVVMMNDPRVMGRLVLDAEKKILDSKAIAFKNWWNIPVDQRLGVDASEQCITIHPVVGGSNYDLTKMISSGSSETTICEPSTFSAHVGNHKGLVQASRAFIDFGNVIAANPNIQIISAQLKLYGVAANGPNETRIERVITDGGVCSETTPSPTWSAQPSVTSANSILLSQTSSPQNYTLNITNMFNNWFLTRDVAGFRIRLKLTDETWTEVSQNKDMSFGGMTSSAAAIPELTICYTTTEERCLTPQNRPINPYTTGILGNWRPYINYTYVVNREQPATNMTQVGKTDIRNSGYYTVYKPFWEWSGGNFIRSFDDGDLGPRRKLGLSPLSTDDPLSRWTWSNKPLMFDQKGNEVESVDALSRYSAALFGYQQSLATAVGVNSRRREIAFDGFEDYFFSLPTDPAPACPGKRHLDLGLSYQNNNWSLGGSALSTIVSHTGKYSLALNGNITYEKQSDLPMLSYYPLITDENDGRILHSDYNVQGFATIPDKKYLLSLWVKENDDASPTNKVNGLTVKINSVDMQVSTRTVPRVEGWKRLDIEFTAASDLFKLELSGNGLNIDDIRILPFDGQMNSFVYDDRSMRLMAQLDENNFATLYEYDEEGTPIRMKKETERGVMTLKESRQSLRKRN